MPRISGVFQFGPFSLDTAEHRLVRDGLDVPLQLKAFETLCILVEHAGRLVSKEELLRQVWPDATVEENNLNKNVSLVRKALGECAGDRCYIETVPRVGYRFIEAVVQSGPAAAGTGLSSETPARQSVAVLYFENLSGDQEDEYFRDGITEDVITELAKIKELRLFPRSTVLAYRDTHLPVTQVGRQLDASYVLEGSIRRAGNRLRITARLVETSTGHPVWSERYDRRLEDVFAIQDEIAQNIARALRVMLTEKERHAIEKVPTHHIEAYDFYLRARQFFYQGRRRDLENARQMFRRALDIDSSYARAYAGVADCCSFLSKWFHVKEDNLRDALAASGTAVELDPECAEARASLGLAEFLNGNYDHAENQFEIALGFDPGLFEASYFYGRSCFAQGQFVKAASLFTRASHACPDDYQAPSLLGLCLRAMGRTTEAAAAFRECLQKAEKHLELHPDDVRAVSLGSNALCGMGDDERALEWTNRALEMDPEEASVLYNVGCSYALLNQTGKALDCLTKALRKGFCHKAWLEHDPDLDSLRHHPRFISLMESFEENLICSG